MDIRHTRLLTAGLALHLCAGLATAQDDEIKRLETATTVFEEIMEAPDNAIPRAILDKAEAVAIFPNTVKAGFIFGGHRGKGVISARNEPGEWSTPAFLTLTGGSFGLQIGAQSVDLILVIMNRRGLEKLLQNGVYPGFPTIFRGLSEFFVGDLMGKALWKLVENAQRFPRRGGRVLCVHGPVSFHRARPCATKWPPRRGLRTGPPASSDCGRP